MPSLPAVSDEARETLVKGLLIAGATTATGWVAQSAIRRVWGRKGRTVPTDDTLLEMPVGQAIVFALISGAIVSAAQTLATRTALAQATRRGLIGRSPEVPIEV